VLSSVNFSCFQQNNCTECGSVAAQVFSQDLNSEGKRSPAKKQCLQPVSSNSQESLHSQLLHLERHAKQSKSAPSGMAAHASMHEQLEIPPIKSAPHYAPAAGTRSEPLAKAEANHSKGQLIAPSVQKQPGTDHFNAKAPQLPVGPADESQKDAALPVTTPDSHEHTCPEGRHLHISSGLVSRMKLSWICRRLPESTVSMTVLSSNPPIA
jgi:hypothetical protein